MMLPGQLAFKNVVLVRCRQGHCVSAWCLRHCEGRERFCVLQESTEAWSAAWPLWSGSTRGWKAQAAYSPPRFELPVQDTLRKLFCVNLERGLEDACSHLVN